jgi:spore coat polysaccharide biosynthesis protein SpsF
MRTVAIIQARMGSSRLPGKSAMLIAGKPMVQHVIERVRQATLLDDVGLAIPMEDGCDKLLDIAHACDVPTFMPLFEANDLLKRYVYAADYYKADVVVRIPADNPCIDPDEIDRIVDFYDTLDKPIGKWLVSNLDCNLCGNGYPGGLGAEVYDPWFMHWLHMNVDDPNLREHPHMWAIEHERVQTIPAPSEIHRPELRFDVNTQADLDYVRNIYEHMPSDFRAADIIAYLEGDAYGRPATPG